MTSSITAIFPSGTNTIVVGGGLAGLSATIEAYRAGNHVILLDKEKTIGGNSAKATSGINAACTSAQLQFNIHDSVKQFATDTLVSGGGRSDSLLINTLTDLSKEGHEWLESFGIVLDNISQCGGHSVPRTHRESPRADGKPTPVGWNIIKALKTYIENEITSKSNPNYGSMMILNNARVIDLIIQDNRLQGVRYEHNDNGSLQELRSDTVILATGGFSADRELLNEYVPHLRHFPTTNGPWATGDGIKLSRQFGISLIDMDQVQLHPTGFIDPNNPDAPTKFLAPEALRGHGGILLAIGSGKRFTNELGTRSQVVEAILHSSRIPEQLIEPGQWPRGAAFLVLNKKAVGLFDPAVIKFYMNRGFFTTVHNGVNELALLLQRGFAGLSASQVTVESLTETFNSYSLSANGNQLDPFGKSVFPVSFSLTDKFYVCAITPAIHYTMGGLKINTATEVLKPSDDPIPIGPNELTVPGLFAAGEVTGGVHGQNRLAGNSLLECVVFGRIAGQRAAVFAKQSSLPALIAPLAIRVFRSVRL